MNANPSLRPSPTFNANADAEALRKAMKGFGTNNAAVIRVLCGRTNWEVGIRPVFCYNANFSAKRLPGRSKLCMEKI